MNPSDLKVMESVFMHGPSSLLEQGWTQKQIDEFLHRPDVRTLLSAVLMDFNDQDALEARMRYYALRRLSRLIPDSLSVVEDILRGPQYVRNEDGSIATDANGEPLIEEHPPGKVELTAAKLVLDKLGIGSDEASTHVRDLNINVLLNQAKAQTVSISYDKEDQSHEQKAMARERVRNAIMKLLPYVSEAQEVVEAGTIKNAKKIVSKTKAAGKKKKTAKLIVKKKS